MKILDLQQRSPEWFQSRLGVITGSRAKKVFSSTNLSFMDELIAERMSGKMEETFQSKAMEHGVLFEPEALNKYIEKTGNDAHEIGFCVHDRIPFMAVSPDALVMHKNRYVGGVEIKCPSTRKHIEYIRQNKIPNEYKHQVFQYFVVCETIDWLDFVSYDPRLSKANLFIKRVTRHEIQDELDLAMEKHIKFYEKLLKYEQQILETIDGSPY
jgi:putative phage-type endonuclease